MDFSAGRYPLNDSKFSLGSYYSPDGDKNTHGLSNAVPYAKYGYTSVSDSFADDITENFDESEKLEENVCENIEKGNTGYSSNTKTRLENLAPQRDAYPVDTKMTAADDKRNAMEETNYIVKLEKMSPETSSGVRDTIKMNNHSEKKKNGIAALTCSKF